MYLRDLYMTFRHKYIIRTQASVLVKNKRTNEKKERRRKEEKEEKEEERKKTEKKLRT